MEKPRQIITNASLFTKIAVAFVLITVASIAATSFLIVNTFSTTVEKKEILLDSAAMREITNYTQEKYNRVYDLLNHMEGSNNIAELLSKVKKYPEISYQYDSIKFINNNLSAILASDSDFLDTILVTESGAVYSDTRDSSRTILVSFDYWNEKEMDRFVKSEQTIAEISDCPRYVENSQKPVISFLAKIYDPSKYPKRSVVGVMILNVATESFEHKFLDYSNELKGRVTLVNSGNQILFSFNRSDWGQQYNRILKDPQSSMVRSMEVGLSGMTVVNVVSPAIFQSETHVLEHNLFLLIVFIVIVSIVIAMLIFRFFNLRIQTLVSSMEKVQDGSLNYRIPIRSHDEIGRLSISFNQMCDRLQDYINRVYYAEIRQKNAELNMLQAQINPHFLFNTLETLRMKAHTEGNEEIASMTALLGDLFRWNIKSSSKILSIFEELEYIKTYLEIQQFRRSIIFEYEIDVPDEIMNLGIPKLILQPLVENVFTHGFEGRLLDGNLAIRGKLLNGVVELSVVDNGSGIDEQTLRGLKTEENAPPSTPCPDHSHIGIVNVHQRLHLIFGDCGGIEIHSRVNVGTEVKVTFPSMSIKEMKKLCGES